MRSTNSTLERASELCDQHAAMIGRTALQITVAAALVRAHAVQTATSLFSSADTLARRSALLPYARDLVGHGLVRSGQ